MLLHHREPVDAHPAGPGLQGAVEVQHERGLACAVRTEDGHPLALVHGQVDAEEHLAAVGVGVGQPLDLQQRRGHRTAHATAATTMAAAGSAKAIGQLRGAAGLVVDDGKDAVVAPRQHGHVDPLTSFEAADEQGAGRRRHRPHLPDPSRVVTAGDPGDAHAVHLVGDHVAIADHEAHDPREHPGEPEAVEAPQQLRHRGGGGQHDAGRHAERALHHDVPGRPQPADRQRQTQDLHLLTLSDDRQEEGEGQEGQLDHEPLEHVGQAEPGDRRHDSDQGGVETEGPEDLAWRRHDGEHEEHRGGQLRLRRQPVDDRPPADVEAVGMSRSHVRARGRRSRPRPVPAGERPCGRAAS